MNRDSPASTAGVNRVRSVTQPQDLGRSGRTSGNSIAETNPETLGCFPPTRITRCFQYPYPCNTGWGDGTTNPTPSACEPVHRGRKDRQADGTARVRSPSNGGRSPDAVSGAVQGDSASVRRRNPPHPLRGSRTECEPEYAHAAESRLRRGRDRPDPEREGTPASTPGRMSNDHIEANAPDEGEPPTDEEE